MQWGATKDQIETVVRAGESRRVDVGESHRLTLGDWLKGEDACALDFGFALVVEL